ncbi:sigma-70 family RNA polymerase sigma factor [candidate division KSB1 bacterium]
MKTKNQNFEKEMLQHLDNLYNFSLSLVKDYNDAKDLVQETYYKAYKFFYQFRAGSNSKAWLISILKNTYINIYSRKMRGPKNIEYNDQYHIGNDVLQHSNINSNSVINKDYLSNVLSDEVDSAVDKLPYKYKTTIILSDIENFSYEEIADIMDCPIGTVRSRLSRGRKILREILLDYTKKME